MKFLKVLLTVIIVIAVLFGGIYTFMTYKMEDVKTAAINEVDPANTDDGVYEGEYKAGRWSNKVEVTVKDHKISDVKIVKDVMIPLKDVEEQLLDNIVDKQSLKVDAVTGATVTGNALKKSIENALTGK